LAKDGKMVVSPTLPNHPKAPPRRPGRPHAQARHLHTHETIIASGSVTAGIWGVRNAWAGGTWGGENQLPPCLVCLKSGVLLENGSGCAAQGADPGHRCRPAPRHQRHLVPRAPCTAIANLFLQKGVRGASPGRGLGLRGGGAPGHPFFGLAVHKKYLFLSKTSGCFSRNLFCHRDQKPVFVRTVTKLVGQ
jgi:hypothetical protein